MVNQIKKPKQEEISNENKKEVTVLNSAVKFHQQTLEYNGLRNQVEQKYYHKIHGCSVKAQE